MVRNENTESMDHDETTVIILDVPTTSRQAQEPMPLIQNENTHTIEVPVIIDGPTTSRQAQAEHENAEQAMPLPSDNSPEVEDIMVKWRKAMKTACEAQKLLQDVMEEMARQMRNNKGHSRNHYKRTGKAKIGQRRPGHHYGGSHHEDEAPAVDECIEINSDNSSESNSDSGDSEVVIIEEASHHISPRFINFRHHHHHEERDRSHSRGHSRSHCRSHTSGHFQGNWEHMMRHPHFPHHHQHPHPHHYPHPHHHPHHHHHHHHGHFPPHHGYRYHYPQHPQANSGFYGNTSNGNASASAIRTIVDTLPLALTL